MEGTAVNADDAANPEGRTQEIVESTSPEDPNETVEQPEVVDAEKTERDKRPGNLYTKHYRELKYFVSEWTRERTESSIQEVLHAVEHFPYIDATKKKELDRIAALLLRSMSERELATARAHLETTTTSGNEPSASMMEDDGDQKPAASRSKKREKKKRKRELKRELEQVREQIRELREQMAFDQLLRSILADASELQICVVEAENELSTLHFLSQEVTANYVGTNTAKAVEEYIEKKAEGAVSTANIAKEVVEKKKELPTAQFLLGRDGDVDKALERVSTAYDSLITKACDGNRILKKGQRDYKAHMSRSTEWFRSRVANNSAETNAPNLWFPGLVSNEINGAQAMLTELVHAISDCFESPKSHWEYSPPTRAIKREAVVAGNEKRPRRIVDLFASKPGCFHLAMLDQDIWLPFEIKPVLGGTKSVDMDGEGCKEILHYLAKACYDGLSFLGIGTSTVATGLTSNLACIQVHQLRLEMHTADSIDSLPPVKVELHKSARLPLMSASCFDTWVKECGKSNDPRIKKLRDELYSVETMGPVPSGILVLYGIMAKRRSETFGPDYQKLFNEHPEVGKVLGHGSFGVVMEYCDGDNNNFVIKVPRFSKSRALEDEQKILKALGRCNCSYIAKVVKQRKLTCSIGNMEKRVAGLVLTPRGAPLPHVLLTEKLSVVALNGFVTHMLKALEAMHHEKIHHNDVAPHNIVVVKKGRGLEAVLVDFESATSPGEKLTGFLGHVPYVHDDVFCKSPSDDWTPENKHDLAALAYTMAAVFGGGKATWDMKGFPHSDMEGLENVLDNRRKQAKRLLSQHKVTDLIPFIDDSSNGSPSRPQKPSKRKETTSPNDLHPRKRKRT